MKISQLSLSIIAFTLISSACGRHKHHEEDQPISPFLHQDMLPESKTETVAESDWSIELKTHLGVSKRKSRGGRNLMSFYFTPQQADSDATSGGNLWFTVGSNPYGEALSSADDLKRYEEGHTLIGGDLEPSESLDRTGPALSWSVESFGKNSFLAVERQCKGVYVKTWYFWIANHKSLIFREASTYPFASLWPDLRAEVESMLGSIVFTESKQLRADDMTVRDTGNSISETDCQ